MKALDAPTVRIVIYEGRGAEPIAPDKRFALMRALLDAGHTVTSAGTAGSVAPGAVASVAESTLIVLGRFTDGAPASAEDAAGHVDLHFRDITGLDTDAAAGQVAAVLEETGIAHNAPAGSDRWKPWFPVIDYDRCTNCMQCLSFCLFDVYGTTPDGQIQVQNNDNCKTDCPACSRVCPEVAILFPKYSAGPINGEEVSEEDVQRESMKVDISSLLGGDIYSKLRDRSEQAKQRFARERDDKQAISERMRCLNKLVQDGTIPKSVLKEMSDLPSQEEIEQKAREAREKAQAAMQQQQGQ